MSAEAAIEPLSATGLPQGALPLEYFRQALKRRRLSHAYLLVGPEGSGRRRFARELAKALFCLHGAPCGSCPSCAAVEHGNHPGVYVYGPGEDRNSIEIADVRSLAAKVHLRRADFLVSIMEEAERMTLPAANAILKTLEEPTGATLLILIARSSGLLLPTIVSRCHRIPFPSPPAAPVEEGSALGEALQREAAHPAFFAERDPREWLGELSPAASLREAVRRLLDGLASAERACWSPPPVGTARGDPSARRLEELLELRSDLERNLNPDLVLEAALELVRSFPEDRRV